MSRKPKVKRLRNLLGALDRVRYLFWRAFAVSRPITLSFAASGKLSLRPEPMKDLLTAYEIFVNQAYKIPPAVPAYNPLLIVDLGANIGCSIVLWLQRHPLARVIAFEPHPENQRIVHRQIRLNRATDKVTLIEAAASNREMTCYLSDAADESTISHIRAGQCIQVKALDFFDQVRNEQIDLLKIDIEGGEFDLLGDSRFASLRVHVIVVEWHNCVEVPDARRWCEERLAQLGFNTTEGELTYRQAGILWAWKN